MTILQIKTTDESVIEVSRGDARFGELVQTIGDIRIPLRTDYLASLVRSIIGQQISVSAASAVYGRLLELLGGKVTVEALLAATEEELREAGLTKRKAEYVKDLAAHIHSGELDLDHIDQYDDKEIMEQLIRVKGIGKWTAEMFLILSLGRPDVLAVDDVGIQRAAQWLYGVERSERKNNLLAKSSGWAPRRSVVSYYLWEAIHLGYLADYDSFEEMKKSAD